MKLFKRFPYILLAVIIVIALLYVYNPTKEGFDGFSWSTLQWYWQALIIIGGIIVGLFVMFLIYTQVTSQAKATVATATGVGTGIGEAGKGIGEAGKGVGKFFTGWGEAKRAEVRQRPGSNNYNNEGTSGGSRRRRR